MTAHPPSWIARLLLALLLVVAAADASADPKGRDRDAARPWVLLPHNIEAVPREYLADGGEIMDTVLAEELDRRGLTYRQLTLVAGLRRWTQAVEHIGGLEFTETGFDPSSVATAEEAFLTSLLIEFRAKGIIWPDLRQRDAEKVRGMLTWDGVLRAQSRMDRYARTEYPTTGSSLRVRIYDEHGTPIADRFRGLEVIHGFQQLDSRYENGQKWVRYSYPVRGDLFEDRRLLRREANTALGEDVR